jgi:hypothetical protein
MKTTILTLVAAAAAACGSAQAHLLGNDSIGKASSSKSALAVMTAAGIDFHARASYGLGAKSAAKPAGARPDDRAGIRGV